MLIVMILLTSCAGVNELRSNSVKFVNICTSSISRIDFADATLETLSKEELEQFVHINNILNKCY